VKATSRLVPLCALVVLAALTVFCAVRMKVATGLVAFVVDTDERELAAVSSALLDSDLTRTMVLAVQASDLDAALDAAAAWGSTLGAHAEVASVRLGPDADFARQVFALYFPHRFAFLSSDPERELPARLEPEGLAAAARHLRSTLAGPRGPLLKEIAGADPLLAFDALVARFERERSGPLEVVRQQFCVPARNVAILFLTTRHSAFDGVYQGPLESFIVASFADLARERGGGLVLERSSVHRFAVASERDGREDLAWISNLSLLAVGALFLAIFRHPRYLLASLLPLAAGAVIATAVGLLVFGELHVITLVFGSTLIGVCIDYPIHFLTHHTLAPHPGGASRSLDSIWPALLLGALTTIAGFMGLAGSDFPGVREIGVFAASGIVGALLCTRILMPLCVPDVPTATRVQVRLAAGLGRLLERLSQRRGALAGMLAVLALVAVAGLLRAPWDDDLYALGRPSDPSWQIEDARVRSLVARMDSGRFIVASGPDEQAALRANDEVFRRLEAARTRGELQDFQSLHPFLASAELQQRNVAVLMGAGDVADRLERAFREAGFRADAFAAFRQGLASGAPEPLQYADLAGSPLGVLVAPFRVQLGDQVAFLTFLRGVGDAALLGQSLSDLGGVYYFDQKSFLAGLYTEYRARVMLLVPVGLLVVLGILCAHFRSLRTAVATLLPAVVSAGAAVGLLGLAGVSINLLHVLAILLVLSMGEDYAIFLVTTGDDPQHRAAAMLSLCYACASTCLSFGLLAFSSFPALQALGAVTGLGVLLSLLTAPTALLLLRPAPAGTARAGR